MGVRLQVYVEILCIPQFSGLLYDKKIDFLVNRIEFFGQSHWSFSSEFLVH